MNRIALPLILALCVALFTSCNSKTEEKPNTEGNNIKLESWHKTAVKDVFGDDTDSLYYAYRCKIKLPTGIRGGSLDAVIKMPLALNQFLVAITPDSTDNAPISYGDYLILHYKPQGGKVSKIKLSYTSEGYKLHGTNLGNLRFIENQKEWAKNHALVKFKGFTSDDYNAERFIDSPNGIGRDDCDVYLNPEFSIQY